MKDHLTPQQFMAELMRYRKGSVTRRHFLGVTGLGMATTVLGAAMPGLMTRPAFAQGSIGDSVVLATWPNYYDPANFEAFTAATGAAVQVNVFGSNEEMLAKLQAGGSGWDVFVPTNYTITTYVAEGLIDPLDLSKIPNYDAASFEPRFAEAGTVDGKLYGASKDWGTTGMAVNTKLGGKSISSWKEFWDITQAEFTGRTTVHDYQLTTIGNALKSFGYSFNSVDPKELADAEKLLLAVKPHLFAITSDYQPPMRAGDAWLAMCWTGDAKQLNKDMPEIQYIIGKEGGEIWSDFYAIPSSAPHKDAAYALINFMLDPAINYKEAMFHGQPVADARVNAMMSAEMMADPIIHPAADLLSTLEFGAAATLTNPDRAELMARFKSA